jgi:hypothetical protein
MIKNTPRLFKSLLIWFISISLLSWCEWPIKTTIHEIDFLPGKLIISPANGSSLTTIKPQTFLEDRRLILEWTPILRKGDLSKVKLSFVRSNPSELDNTNLSSFKANFENVYEIYSVIAESRLELIGAEIDPGGLSGQVLSEGQDIHFTWTLIPGKSGVYAGTAWFYLKLYPLNGNSSFIEQAVSAQTIDIKVISLLGLNSNLWRFLGVIGLGIGFIVLNFENIRSLLPGVRQKLKGKRI